MATGSVLVQKEPACLLPACLFSRGLHVCCQLACSVGACMSAASMPVQCCCQRDCTVLLPIRLRLVGTAACAGQYAVPHLPPLAHEPLLLVEQGGGQPYKIQRLHRWVQLLCP